MSRPYTLAPIELREEGSIEFHCELARQRLRASIHADWTLQRFEVRMNFGRAFYQLWHGGKR